MKPVSKARAATRVASLVWGWLVLMSLSGEVAAASREIPAGSAHPALVATIGLYEDGPIDSMLQEVGGRVAAQSRQPDRPWSFWLLDDPALNVFAVPPAAVYLTRGLFLHLDSEAELAAILAHAIAHLNEAHKLHEIPTEELQKLGIGLPSLAKRDLLPFSPLAVPGLELLTGTYKASDDRRADDLAIRALERAGYDLQAPAGIYALLDELAAFGGPAERLPNWWQTHPGPENRSKRAAKEAATYPQDRRTGTVGREPFIALLEGLVYGWNLERPYFDKHNYFNRRVGFQLDLPPRWKRAHLGESILAVSPEGDAALLVSPTEAVSNVEALRAFFADPELEAKRSWRRSVHNLSAVWATFVARRDERDLEGRVGFIVLDETVYRLLGYGLERLWLRHFSDVQRTFEGMRRPKPPAEGVPALESARIELLEMEEDLGLSQLEEKFPSATSRRNVRALNRLSEGRRIAAGELFKHVVGGLEAVKQEEPVGGEGEESEGEGEEGDPEATDPENGDSNHESSSEESSNDQPAESKVDDSASSIPPPASDEGDGH